VGKVKELLQIRFDGRGNGWGREKKGGGVQENVNRTNLDFRGNVKVGIRTGKSLLSYKNKKSPGCHAGASRRNPN